MLSSVDSGSRPRSGARLATWFVMLLFFSILLRLPSFFIDVIDPDESVFILTGQALADGHLPYTLVWEIKPPLGFLFYTAAVLLVPDSLAFVRLCGAILVALAGLVVARLALRLMPARESLLAGFLTVMAMSLLIPSARAVMMEHVALVPLLGALLLLTTERRLGPRSFCIGAALGIATLMRTNLAMVPLAVVAALLFWPGGRRWRDRLADAVLVAAGGLAAVLLSYLPYALSGRSDLFLRSVFLAPLAYAGSGPGWLETALAMAERALPALELSLLTSPSDLLRLLLWVLGFGGLLRLALDRSAPAQRAACFWTLVFATAAFASILISSRPWGHYLLQVAPFFALGAAFLVARPRRRLAGACALALALLLFAAMPPPSAYSRLVARHQEGLSLYEGRSFAIADHLRSVSAPEDSLLLTHDILIYWLSNRYPLVPVAAFPGNLWAVRSILRPLYGPEASTEAILQQVLCHAPTRIVAPSDPADQGLAGVEPLRSALSRDYLREAEVADRLIYRRRSGSVPSPCPFPEPD